MKINKAALHILFISFCIVQCNAPENEKEKLDLLIYNAQIINVESGEVKKSKMIGIVDDTIRIVDENAAYTNYTTAKTIDAKNNFVMPGLWDMHVHFRGGDSLIEENRRLLPMFLAYGVTTVRDAGGDITPSVLEWRQKIAIDEMTGPDIFSSGPKFDGAEPAWEGSIKIVDRSEIQPAMDSVQKMGVDYIKIYDGTLSEQMYYKIIKEASARDLKVTGHMPMNADLMQAVALGLDGIEHLYYVLAVSSPVGDSLRALNRGYGILPALLETFDEEKASEAFRKLGENDFYATPTLHIGEVLMNLRTEDHQLDSLLPNIGAGIQQTYERRIRSARNRSDAGQEMQEQMRSRFEELVVPMKEAGIIILAGSDSGPYNSFVYPGASLQGELIALVEAGLTPQEALVTSIINGPRFFNVEDHYGSIEEGNVGNLIILERNPLEDIQNIRSLSTVIKGSLVYDRKALNEML